jgi:catechol 2,3-dioxygenase-like lactoylglutathione lyase family enzyme
MERAALGGVGPRSPDTPPVRGMRVSSYGTSWWSGWEANHLSLSMTVSNAAVMHLNHLGLPVRGLRRSQQFYSAYFGFDPATAQEYEDGTVIIRNADGFDLALHPVRQVEPSPAFLHAGFKAAQPADVRALMERMDADGVTIVERNDEAAYVAFKCLDPDGHRIEVYWEPLRVQ